MVRNILVLLLLWAVVCFFCSASSATIPHMINYQGKLTTASGGCLNDTVQMTFTIYSDSLGTVSEWNEIQTEVIVKDGIFNVLLGSVDSISAAVFDGSIKYLGVQVESDPEMTPLKPMVSVAYAYRSVESDTADFALSGAPDDDWDLDTAGVNVYRLTGNVGIGTPSPQYKLDIRGTTGIDVGTNFGDVPLTINVPSDQSALISRIAKGGSVINVVDAEGNVGIGTFSPQEKLDVAGITRTTGFEMPTGASNGYVLTSDASGVGTWQPGGGGTSCGWIDDGDVVRLETNTDSVGIGTSSPGAPLQVGNGTHPPVFLNTDVQVDHNDASSHRMEIRNDNGATGWSIDASGTTTFGPISATKNLYLLGGNSVRMTIDGSSGDVGIGTTSPDAPLQVGSGSHVPVLTNTTIQVDHDDATEHNIEIRNNSGASGWRINSTGSTTFGPLSAGKNLFLLGGNSTRMTIDGTSGNVGIGTTDPQKALHVWGGNAGTDPSWIMSDKMIIESNSSAYLQFFTPSSAVSSGIMMSNPSGRGKGGVFYSHDSNRLNFMSNGSVKMVIDADGSVGVGTTSPQGALDVNSTTGAFIVPRMTTAQRDALTAVNGMIIYNTSTNQFNFYENGAWVTK